MLSLYRVQPKGDEAPCVILPQINLKVPNAPLYVRGHQIPPFQSCAHRFDMAFNCVTAQLNVKFHTCSPTESLVWQHTDDVW